MKQFYRRGCCRPFHSRHHPERGFCAKADLLDETHLAITFDSHVGAISHVEGIFLGAGRRSHRCIAWMHKRTEDSTSGRGEQRDFMAFAVWRPPLPGVMEGRCCSIPRLSGSRYIDIALRFGGIARRRKGASQSARFSFPRKLRVMDAAPLYNEFAYYAAVLPLAAGACWQSWLTHRLAS